jgi:hypothetical protein
MKPGIVQRKAVMIGGMISAWKGQNVKGEDGGCIYEGGSYGVTDAPYLSSEQAIYRPYYMP